LGRIFSAQRTHSFQASSEIHVMNVMTVCTEAWVCKNCRLQWKIIFGFIYLQRYCVHFCFTNVWRSSRNEKNAGVSGNDTY